MMTCLSILISYNKHQENNMTTTATSKVKYAITTNNELAAIVNSKIGYTDDLSTLTDVAENDYVFHNSNLYQRQLGQWVLVNTSIYPTAMPANATLGESYFEPTIRKPLWWDGTNWIDANGGVFV